MIFWFTFEDFFNFPNVINVALLACFVAIGLFLGIAYFLWWKPRLESPLPNEKIIGNVLFWGPRGIGVVSGLMTTARDTMERYYGELIKSEQDPDKRAKHEVNRKFVMERHICAIRSGREKKILLFDKNPQDEQFLAVDPELKMLVLHSVQDGFSVGKENGFEFIALSLSKETHTFSPDEMKVNEIAANSLMFLRDAATNTERISNIQTMLDDKSRALKISDAQIASTTAELDAALHALSKKPLTVSEETKVKAGLGQVLKQWFQWYQWLLGFIGFLLAPTIEQAFGWELTPPATTWAALGVAVACFFAVPVVQRIVQELRG